VYELIILEHLSRLHKCVFIERVNRFTAKVRIEDHIVYAHITNTGRLHEILIGGREGFCLEISGSKLNYRLIALADPLYSGSYMVIDTITQNRVFEKAIENNLLPWLRDCRIIRRNPRVHGSILDYLLECSGGRVYVETKSAVLRGPHGESMYPDCPSLRGRRHLEVLMDLWRRGMGVSMVFIAGFRGAYCFMPYRDGDCVFDELLCNAYRLGLPIHGFSIYMDSYGRVVLDRASLNLCSYWWCLSSREC